VSLGNEVTMALLQVSTTGAWQEPRQDPPEEENQPLHKEHLVVAEPALHC
jgi:hypothetical protein